MNPPLVMHDRLSPPVCPQVLEEGALQPVIGLLSSPCPESQREAALLLGQFATTAADTKARIAQVCQTIPSSSLLEGAAAAQRFLAPLGALLYLPGARCMAVAR